ncbi:unnamed protein product [Plutella xylostella]|uniref:(diamondback moth) hypothetical protein n=1 Tax=Plutella xylostella TaxID=51655 RepID=A0A8S4GAD9_PLUXY|nr:unnamed protein product [Plutella xylostella]
MPTAVAVAASAKPPPAQNGSPCEGYSHRHSGGGGCPHHGSRMVAVEKRAGALHRIWAAETEEYLRLNGMKNGLIAQEACRKRLHGNNLIL